MYAMPGRAIQCVRFRAMRVDDAWALEHRRRRAASEVWIGQFVLRQGWPRTAEACGPWLHQHACRWRRERAYRINIIKSAASVVFFMAFRFLYLNMSIIRPGVHA